MTDKHSVRFSSPTRRLLALLPLGILGCLTVAAMLFSLHTSPRVAYFPTPRSGIPAIVHQLRAAIRTTLAAPSFQYRSGADVINYQAPDRTQSSFALGVPAIIIGHTAYIGEGSDTNVVTQWGKGPLVGRLSRDEGPAAVRWDLKDLQGLTSITRHGDVFVALQVVPAGEVEPELPGQVLVVFTVRVRSGYVVSIHPVFHGFLPTATNLPGGHIKFFTATRVSGQTETYSKFGQVPPITAPHGNIVRLRPCPDGDFLGQSGSHACGL